jgi:hypothetical protein
MTTKVNSLADLIVETLTQAGVRRIYGVVGDSLNGFNDALRAREAIDWVRVRMKRSPLSPPLTAVTMNGRRVAALALAECGLAHHFHRPELQKADRRKSNFSTR